MQGTCPLFFSRRDLRTAAHIFVGLDRDTFPFGSRVVIDRLSYLDLWRPKSDRKLPMEGMYVYVCARFAGID